jgi:parvulin-like peptidyl-prolyl isomerase
VAVRDQFGIAMACAALFAAACDEKRAMPTTSAIDVAVVDDAIAKLPPPLRERFETNAGKDEMRRALLDKALLAEEAHRRGITERPNIKADVQKLEERLAIQALLADEMKATSVSEEELKEYWERRPTEFSEGERARVSRVFVAMNNERAASRAKAEALRARLVKGEPLATVVKESDGPERVRGGDLGFIRRDADDHELARAAFALAKTGDISPVVETKAGFSVLILSEKSPARVIPFSEARAQVENKMRPTLERRAFERLLERLRRERGDST